MLLKILARAFLACNALSGPFPECAVAVMLLIFRRRMPLSPASFLQAEISQVNFAKPRGVSCVDDSLELKGVPASRMPVFILMHDLLKAVRRV
jgi:hypothetical protein